MFLALIMIYIVGLAVLGNSTDKCNKLCHPRSVAYLAEVVHRAVPMR